MRGFLTIFAILYFFWIIWRFHTIVGPESDLSRLSLDQHYQISGHFLSWVLMATAAALSWGMA